MKETRKTITKQVLKERLKNPFNLIVKLLLTGGIIRTFLTSGLTIGATLLITLSAIEYIDIKSEIERRMLTNMSNERERELNKEIQNLKEKNNNLENIISEIENNKDNKKDIKEIINKVNANKIKDNIQLKSNNKVENKQNETEQEKE